MDYNWLHPTADARPIGAKGWGSFAQKRQVGKQFETIELKWGKLRLRSLAFALPVKTVPKNVCVVLGGTAVASRYRVENGRVVIDLAAQVVLQAGERIDVTIDA